MPDPCPRGRERLVRSRIPFIEARFFDPDETRFTLQERFEEHLRHLRAGRAVNLTAVSGTDSTDESLFNDPADYITLSRQDRDRIQHRVGALLDRRAKASGLDHLRKEDRERLQVLKDGVELVRVSSEDHADRLAAEIHAEMPWMAPATEVVWHAMRRSVREGWPGLRLPPLFLDGPPGVGKSHWARLLGKALCVPTTVIEATGENASFGVVGSQRGWSGACPGRLVETVLRSRIGNPVILVDEIDKAGTPTTKSGHSFGLAEALLPLLEPLSARSWNCPYYRVSFDMGWVIWVLTSNDWRRLPRPLLSRCPPIRLQNLSRAELAAFVRREAERRQLSGPATEALIEALESRTRCHQQPSLRTATRMLRRAMELELAPIIH